VLLGADALIGLPSVLFAAEGEGKTIEMLPLGIVINVLDAGISVLEDAMKVGLIHGYG
jgi:hypothetical protein